jgi:hypothetical protein
MPYSFWNEATPVTGTGTIQPAGPFPGGSLFITAIDNANLNTVNPTNYPKSRNFISNPSAGIVYIFTPGPEAGVIRVYSFTSSGVLSNLWQVPTAEGNPLVPIGTTFSTLNEVINACGSAGCIYWDSAGAPKVNA